jgi:hypothetical protein
MKVPHLDATRRLERLGTSDDTTVTVRRDDLEELERRYEEQLHLIGAYQEYATAVQEAVTQNIRDLALLRDKAYGLGMTDPSPPPYIR